jgi:membrane-associated phospholipid phosphatase
MTYWPRLRASEWIFVAFFTYIAVVSHWFPNRPNLHHQPLVILVLVTGGLVAVALLEQGRSAKPVSYLRDFLPPVVTLLAFREMEYFLPFSFDNHLETVWIVWDRLLLDSWHLRVAIESLGWLIPSYLELCYLLVYGLPFYCVAILYWTNRRARVDCFFVIYLVGTLVAYSLFPFFPSRPPRLVFPNLDQPAVHTVLRRINLDILSAATIHVGVFPSAHVSSAFSAVWGMFLALPRRKAFAWTLLIYAISVSIATIYGRYHYAADVAAGFAVSLVAAIVGFLLHKTKLF